MLTHDTISRIDITREAFIMALTQFVNGDIWKDDVKVKGPKKTEHRN